MNEPSGGMLSATENGLGAPPATGIRRLARPLLRPSIRRDIAIGCLLLLLIGLAFMQVSDYVFERQTGFINLVNTAGRLRLLSQRIAYIAHHTETDPRQPGASRAELARLVERFDNDLDELIRTSTTMAIFDGNDMADHLSLGVIIRQWQGYRRAATILAAQPVNLPQAQLALHYIDDHAQSLLATADNNVRHIIQHSIDDRAWLSGLLYLMLSVGVLLVVVTFVYIRTRLLQPFAAIVAMAARLAGGKLDARVSYPRQDEVGSLIRRLNFTAAAMQELFARKTQAEDILRESEARSRLVLETSRDAILFTDADGIVSFANQSVAATFGYQPAELIGADIFVLYPERYRARHQAGMADWVRSGKTEGSWRSMEIWARHKSGREIRVDLSVNHLRLGSGDLFAGFFHDLSDRNAVQADLHLRNRAIESTGEGVMISDVLAHDHPIIYVNPAFERITGFCRAEVVGHNGRLLLGDALARPEVETLRQILRERKAGVVTLDCLKKDGSRYSCEISAAPVSDSRGSVTHYISVFKDVSERLRQIEEMLHWTHHDVLTGLPNRILFQDRLQQAIIAAGRRRTHVGVLFVDLDGFKAVNDTLGHNAGDSLLREAAQRLQGCVRDGDTVARLGGDEFIMLLNEVEGDYGIEPVAARTLAALNRAFEFKGQEVFVGASIGTSVFPRDGEDGETLVRSADLAMYQAKEYGRNNVQAFSAELHTRRERWVTIESKLRRAVDRGDFLLHFQPQLSLGNGRVIGCEALIRWQDNEMGMVSPSQFIPLAEETGLIGAIGEWVLDHACQQIKCWRLADLQPPRVAINISARQFRQANLFPMIEHGLARHQLDASCLEIELTESMVMQDPERTIGVLSQMREAGLHLSLDDFGTGYSSLSYLRRFPLDVLKVDQSFVREVPGNEEAAAIAGAIITLAHCLNLGVVAEGVESAGQLDFLIAQRCDVIQGYYFSKPLPAAEFATFLQRNRQVDQCQASF